MNIIPYDIYHIYNQGNNREAIFYADKDYIEFLKLFRKYILPHCKILAYCLMPNHFHFLVYTTENSVLVRKIGNIQSTALSNSFRILQSTYAQYINKKQNRTGSLFRQKAKAKSMSDGSNNYSYIAFHYIHQNPLQAGLVKKLEDWKYSSFNDYAGLRDGTLCNKELGKQLIGLEDTNFMTESYRLIDDKKSRKLFIKNDEM